MFGEPPEKSRALVIWLACIAIGVIAGLWVVVK